MSAMGAVDSGMDEADSASNDGGEDDVLEQRRWQFVRITDTSTDISNQMLPGADLDAVGVARVIAEGEWDQLGMQWATRVVQSDILLEDNDFSRTDPALGHPWESQSGFPSDDLVALGGYPHYIDFAFDEEGEEEFIINSGDAIYVYEYPSYYGCNEAGNCAQGYCGKNEPLTVSVSEDGVTYTEIGVSTCANIFVVVP